MFSHNTCVCHQIPGIHVIHGHLVLHHSCMVAQAVAKIAEGMGMAKFRPPLPGSKTSKWISMKLGIYHYIVGMTTHANPCGAAAMWVAHGWSRPICDLSHFSVLVYLFFVYFILQLALSLHQLILMINTSHNVFLHKEMPFGVAMRQLAPGVKSPKSPILGA